MTQGLRLIIIIIIIVIITDGSKERRGNEKEKKTNESKHVQLSISTNGPCEVIPKHIEKDVPLKVLSMFKFSSLIFVFLGCSLSFLDGKRRGG